MDSTGLGWCIMIGFLGGVGSVSVETEVGISVEGGGIRRTASLFGWIEKKLMLKVFHQQIEWLKFTWVTMAFFK